MKLSKLFSLATQNNWSIAVVSAVCIVLGTTEVSSAVVLMLGGPAPQTYKFTNTQLITATDFKVSLAFPDQAPPPAIGGGNGGIPFPVTNLQLPAAGGGFLRVIYDGGPGIAPGGMHTHSFIGFPAGFKIEALFSYNNNPNDLREPQFELLSAGASAQGKTVASVPEPTSTLSILALGTLGAASTLKRKLKPSQSIENETTKVG